MKQFNGDFFMSKFEIVLCLSVDILHDGSNGLNAHKSNWLLQVILTLETKDFLEIYNDL